MDEAERKHLIRDPAEYLFVFSLFDSANRHSSSTAASDPGDNLQQWRAYSKGAVGYSIGFDRAMLESKVRELDDAMQYTFCDRCIYEDSEKRNSVKRATSVLAPACDLAVSIGYAQKQGGRQPHGDSIGSTSHEMGEGPRLQSAGPSEERNESQDQSRAEARELISNALSTHFGRVLISSALMKHAAFAEEHEWRVVRLAFALSKEIKFRATSRGIIPYSAVTVAATEDSAHIMPGLIRRVVVGPLGNASREARARAISVVQMLLENNGIAVARTPNDSGAIVEISGLPC